MHRLETILGEGYSTIGRVSGSAVVYEAGDHQEAILTRDGELAAFGGGRAPLDSRDVRGGEAHNTNFWF